jgi:transcriptional regulator with XRE-family HTH domain
MGKKLADAVNQQPPDSPRHDALEQVSFGQLLRHFRLAAGLSQETLAERAGLSVQGLSLLENGRRQAPYRSTVAMLAQALDLSREERTILEATVVRRGPRVSALGESTPVGDEAPSVFLAHADEDTAFAARLRDDLTLPGIAWANLSAVQTGPTRRETAHWIRDDRAQRHTWEETLRAAVRTCRVVVLVASPAAHQSRAVRAALAVAGMYGRRVVPVWCAGDRWLDCVPPSLASSLPIDARRLRYGQALTELVAAVEPLVAADARRERYPPFPAPQASRNPYKGLRAFGEEDTADYFGRAALVEVMLEALQTAVGGREVPAARLLAAVGPSGSGKSSLVRAGLLPRLKAGALPGSDGWVYLDPVLPGTHPLEALTVVLAGKFEQSMHSLGEDLHADSCRGLHLLARRLAARPEQRLVLVVDQLEELFTLTVEEDERRQFIDLLVAAVTEPRGPLLAILTLRADCYDRPMTYPSLGALLEARSRSVLPMSVAELREAIERPAGLSDVQLTFERGLVGDLLFETAGQAGALPLLEFTLEQLVARRQGRVLTAAVYQEIGGVRGALSRQAEATFADLPSDEHRHLVRALFLRLIEPGATEQDTTRRRAALSELALPDARQAAWLQEVADAFVTARLLTSGEHAGVSTLEVSHEALIGAWSRLQDWLREAREDVRLQHTISADAAAWARHGRQADHLYRGSVLQEAKACRAPRRSPSWMRALPRRCARRPLNETGRRASLG